MRDPAPESNRTAGTTHGYLLSRLRERGVLRVAASYAVIAWLTLQIASVVVEPLGVPKWVMTALILAAVIGLPIAIGLAWFLEIGESSITSDAAAEGVARPATRGLRQYADAIVIGMLLVAAVVLGVRQSDLARPKPPATPSIAVLPFENESGDPGQDYFGDGLADEMLERLGRVPGLKVIARSSSFSFKGTNTDARTIAGNLGVTTVLEGGVRRNGRHLRLTARLIDGTTGNQIWSGSFDRDMTDIFRLQEELARAIVDAVIPAARGGVTRQAPPAEADLSAYDLYLLAKTTEWQRSPEAVQRAVQLLERSIERDPNYAPAHAQLALALWNSLGYSASDPTTTREKADREAHAALALDPSQPAARLVQAWGARANGLSDEKTREEIADIVRTNPNYAPAVYQYGRFLGLPQSSPEVRRWLAKSLALDPLAITPRLNLIGSLHDAGDTQGMLRELQRYEQLHSGDVDGQFTLARSSLRMLDDPVRAAAAARRAIALSPPNPTPAAMIMLHRALLAAGDFAAADALLLRADWSTTSPATLAYEQALAAGSSHNLPALTASIGRLRALPSDPARDSALLLWSVVSGDCPSALHWFDSAGKSGPIRNYTLAGFERDDAVLAYYWCTRRPGDGSEDRKGFDEDLAMTEADLASSPKSVGLLINSAAMHSIQGHDDQAISRLERAVERAPLAISFQPGYPWFARLAGHPGYDRVVAARLRAQAEARRQIAAAGVASEAPGPTTQ